MKEDTKDYIYTILKGSVGTIPVAGPVLSELFGRVFEDPANKRRENIILGISDRVKKLEEDGFDLKDLSTNEEFLSIVIQAYNIAMKTHQEEKRIALLNAISNTPKLTSIDENEKMMFLNYIDYFNEWHLRILLFLDSPYDFLSFKSGSRASALEIAYPDLKDKSDFYGQIVKDLYNRGLIQFESLFGKVFDATAPGTTEYGVTFIDYITH